LESKIKDCEASLEKKDFLLQATEGSLVELQAKNARSLGCCLQLLSRMQLRIIEVHVVCLDFSFLSSLLPYTIVCLQDGGAEC
jgi:hypothetical protein